MRARSWAMVVPAGSIEQSLPVSVAFMLLPIPVAVRLALHLLPIDQLDRRRHHTHERRPLDGLEALAAAARLLILAAAELHRLAARRLQRELVEPARHQRPAQARVA